MNARVAGFRMPAEWEPHAATWLVWPHNRDDWRTKTTAVEWCYVEMVHHLVRGERVALVCQHARVRQRACHHLERCGVDMTRIDTHLIPTNRSWIRDSGPIFVLHGDRTCQAVVAMDWRFTGWSRYRAHALDHALPRRIARDLGMERIEVVEQGVQVVLEGGSIDVNGEGLLLTTETCLLGHVQARNPGLSRETIEQALGRRLGVEQVLWLPGGVGEQTLPGDDTHGHIDNLARFVGPTTVVAATIRNRRDPRYPALAANLARLRSLRTAQGRALDVIPIRMPQPIVFGGEPLPASYLNFYIANDVVLVPTFNDPADRDALATLARCFPNREVTGIHATDLIVGLGAIHCVTQQQPAGHAA